MQTMEEMVKTYYKKGKKFKRFDYIINKIERKIQKLASNGKHYYESGYVIKDIDVLEEIANVFEKHGYSAWIDRWNGGICIRWKVPEEIK